MNVFEASAESSPGLEIVMPVGEPLDDFRYLDPDASLDFADQGARGRAARHWAGMTVLARQAAGVNKKAYFQDALGAGFFLPGCVTCVSDRGMRVLEPHLRGQVSFLPLEILGAPMPYWILYATRFYDKIDIERSSLREAPSYVADRRAELRQPWFLDSPELAGLMIFRVAGAKDYVPFALGDYVTQNFVDLVIAHRIGGFAFTPCHAGGDAALESFPPTGSSGPKYQPSW